MNKVLLILLLILSFSVQAEQSQCQDQIIYKHPNGEIWILGDPTKCLTQEMMNDINKGYYDLTPENRFRIKEDE